MSTVLSDGCLCGAVRYEYAGEAGPANYCHCTDCRKRTGGAFNISVRLSAGPFRIVKGNPKGFTKTADSGNELTRYFCAECGSPLYTAPQRYPDSIFITAGSMDDPALVKPRHQSWTASSVPWAAIDPDLPAYPRGRS